MLPMDDDRIEGNREDAVEDKLEEQGLEPQWEAQPDEAAWAEENPSGASKTADSARFALPPLPESGGAGGVITVRGLSEGAMMAALTLILAVISMYVPILNIIAPLLFPAPLALVVLRHGLKLGSLCAVSVLLLCSMLLGLPHTLFLFVQFGFLGLYFGWCFRQKIRAAYILFGGVMLSSAAIVFSFVFPSLVAGVSLEQYQAMIMSFISDYVNMLQQSGNSELVMRGMTPAAYLTFMEDFFRRLLPGMLMISAMMLTWLCYVLMCKLLRRFGYEVGKLPAFINWRLDWRFLWALIIALALAGLGSRFGYDMVARVGDNLLMAFAPILLVCGISVAAWLLKSWRVATFIKILLVLFVVQVFGGAIEIFILVGVFDPLFDFRRRITRMREKKQAG